MSGRCRDGATPFKFKTKSVFNLNDHTTTEGFDGG
jgi:hypothetical protein